MAQNWGHCKHCKFFDSESPPRDDDEAGCMQDDLAEFELRVTGASGCNAFEARQEKRPEPPRPSP